MTSWTVDSSVFVSSLLEGEAFHQEALIQLAGIMERGEQIVVPYSVLVEVVGAIRRRADEDIARSVPAHMSAIPKLRFVPIDESLAAASALLAATTALRGMDALIVQTAITYGSRLLTFDGEMKSRASSVLPQPPIV